MINFLVSVLDGHVITHWPCVLTVYPEAQVSHWPEGDMYLTQFGMFPSTQTPCKFLYCKAVQLIMTGSLTHRPYLNEKPTIHFKQLPCKSLN